VKRELVDEGLGGGMSGGGMAMVQRPGTSMGYEGVAGDVDKDEVRSFLMLSTPREDATLTNRFFLPRSNT
jgi:hypothetical protein